MDDSRFDDIVKGKIGEFEDSTFDPSAIAALHSRMASESDWPWHIRYRTEIVVASATMAIILFTMLTQWYFNALNAESYQLELKHLREQNDKMNGLLASTKELKTPVADTITIIERRERDPLVYAELVRQIDDLKVLLTDSLRAILGSGGAKSALTAEGSRASLTGFYQGAFHPFEVSTLGFAKAADSGTSDGAVSNVEPRKLSAREIIKKENYKRGVGFRLGPTADVSQGLYPAGVGEVNVGYGVLADFILSPTLSFETGIKYTHRFYMASENELSKIALPFVNASVGPVKLAEIDSRILEIPLNVKYRLPLSMKTSFVGRIGYSSMIYTGQTLEYSYEFDPANNLFAKDSHNQNSLHFYPGALNFSVGASRLLKNKKILEGGLFHQQGLGKAGVEKNRPSYFGARAVYWFPIR